MRAVRLTPIGPITMKNKIRIGFALYALTWAAGLCAAVDISISGLKPAAWVLRSEVKSSIDFESLPVVGDRLITGETGQVELRLGADAILQINSNSEVEVAIDQDSSVKGRPELHLHKGRACIRYTAVSEIESGLALVLGDTLFAEISIRGDVCALRRDGMSALKLRGGKVRITHAVDRNIVVLSSIGTEYFAGDKGEFRLISPGVDALASSDIEQPFAVDPPPAEDLAAGATAGEARLAENQADALGSSENGEPLAGPVEVFSVYLFSSRSADAADDVNQRFRGAGFESQVVQVSDGAETRYRVAVSGFPSRRAAQNFADAIVGRLGISDTWIGRAIR